MTNEPKNQTEENPDKKIKIERIPEPMFGGTRERLSVLSDDRDPSEDSTAADH